MPKGRNTSRRTNKRNDHSNTRNMQTATNRRIARAFDDSYFASGRAEGRTNMPGQRSIVLGRGPGASRGPATSPRPLPRSRRQPSNTGRRTYSTRAR